MKQFTEECYRNSSRPTWCNGCLYFGILTACTRMFAACGIPPYNISVISGIGCSSRMPLFLNTYGCHTLHGRAIPVAVGARLARPDIPVVVVAGDGDIFSIGLGHFVHAARKNVNITVFCCNNFMYAMTKKQSSPTSPKNFKGTLTPFGKLSEPLNVLELALSSGATFISRIFAGHIDHMVRIMHQAFLHEGFSFVEIIAPCRTFENKMDIASIASHCADVASCDEYDVQNKEVALNAMKDGVDFSNGQTNSIPTGVFYKKSIPTLEAKINSQKKNGTAAREFSTLVDTFLA